MHDDTPLGSKCVADDCCAKFVDDGGSGCESGTAEPFAAACVLAAKGMRVLVTPGIAPGDVGGTRVSGRETATTEPIHWEVSGCGERDDAADDVAPGAWPVVATSGAEAEVLAELQKSREADGQLFEASIHPRHIRRSPGASYEF